MVRNIKIIRNYFTTMTDILNFIFYWTGLLVWLGVALVALAYGLWVAFVKLTGWNIQY